MKTKATDELKEKSRLLKILKKGSKCECPCIHFIFSILQNNKQRSTIFDESTAVVSKEAATASNEDVTETSKETADVPETPQKNAIFKPKNSRVFHLPRFGCTVPFLMGLFNDLTKDGTMYMEAAEISRAVNIILKVKMDLDDGKPWNGKVEVAENLYLKLNKSGLALQHKK